MKPSIKKQASFEEIAAQVYPILEKHGVVRAGLFGSFARGEAHSKSDVDLVVDFGETKPASSWMRYDIELELEEKLGRKVDLSQYKLLKDFIKKEVEQTQISIMAKHKDIRPYLNDIIKSIDFIEKYMDNVGFEQFNENDEKKDAVIRRIEIMGEAVKRIPYDFRVVHPEIPWKEIAGMRDVAIHDYDKVDDDIVWKVATEFAPSVKKPLQKILENLF